MPHPKRRTSKSSARQRRTHKKLTAPTVISCPNCAEAVRPHHVCPSCGQYRGQEVLSTTTM
ncbi:MAG: 50S ribosomal protein L32 [Nitrospirota bacterium]|nr:50S ribosomal protein L32 [Nitrospirota bacterium]